MSLINITKTKMARNIYFFSDPKLYIYIYYVNFIAFFHRIWYSIFPRPSLEIPKDDTQEYIDNKTEAFLKTFPRTDEERKKGNANIDQRCYSLESFQEIIQEENNDLEAEWKRRLMVESTPRGNVIMFYDIYKQAFAYVSDQHMNYSILNACAMKYVQIYRCADFFLDGNIIPEDLISRFVLLKEEVEKGEKAKESEKKKEMGIQFNNAPFAKLKTYRDSDLIKGKNVSFKTDIQNNFTKIKSKNTFRYLGKISNLSFLQKPKQAIIKNPLISCPIESFDYLEYKNRFKKKMEEKEPNIEDEKEDIFCNSINLEYDSTSTTNE